MNIAIVGPEKYKFQDLVCLDIGLSLGASGLQSMVPEPNGGEDTVFEWSGAQAIRVLEVQVKGTLEDLTLGALAEYLTHYPDRRATGSLLERLADETDRAVLFVTSGRLTDPLSRFRLQPNLEQLPKAHTVGHAELGDFVTELTLLAAGTPTSALDAKRRADIAKLAALSSAKLRGALSRVFVIAEEIQATVETRLHGRLRAMRFDTLSLRGTIAALTDDLDAAKKSQANVLETLRRRLDELAPAAVAPADYVTLGLEADLLDRLRSDGVLLLTGPPRAGKSWTQRALGGALQSAGYEVRQGASVEEADRFLTDASGGERLFLLDDPFGSREAHEKASSYFADLRRLVERLRGDRRLIVAQVDHVLYEICRSSELSKCSLGTRGWTPVQPLAADKATEIWASAASEMSLPASTIARVDALIASDDRLRSPGALTYLAHALPDLPDTIGDEAIAVFAHSDASDFARILVTKNQAVEPMLATAAIATRSDRGASRTELAYVIDGKEDLPGLRPKWAVVSMGGPEPELPNYAAPPALTADQQAAHDLLARRRVIEEREHRTNFPHPYLRAGAQMLLRPDLPGDKELTRDRLLRAIGSLSPDVSLSAARNLGWILQTLDADAEEPISYSVAEDGLRSIFPATRDACFAFLMEHAERLPREMRKQVPHWAQYGLNDLDDIVVDRGVAFLSSKGSLFRSHDVALSVVQPYLDAIDQGRPLGLDLPLSRQILTALRAHPVAMTPKIVERFLLADEALVRAEAARIWVSIPRVDDRPIIERLRTDGAPAVGIAVFEALAEVWPEIDDDRREALMEAVEHQAASMATASVLFSRLVMFDREEEFGDAPPWPIFVRLVPTVLDRLPANVALNNGRFNTTMESAVAAGLTEELIPAVEAWTRRCIERLRYYFLDDYELAMVDSLVAVTKPGQRHALLEELFAIEDTGARTVIAADIANNWEGFDADERIRIVSWLTEGRQDQRWLSAIMLTRRELDPAIMKAITGRDDISGLDPRELENLLGADLFEACVRTFVGRPQPLWWYGKHHGNRPFWEPIIRSLARIPTHPLFDDALSNVVSFDDEDTIERTVNKIPVDGLTRAFEVMLANKIKTTGEWHCAAWVALLERGEMAGQLDGWLETIDDKLDAILESLSDVQRWLAKSRFADRVFEMLRNDLRALRLVIDVAKALDEIGSQETDANDSASDPVKRATLFDAAVTTAIAASPRLMESWSRIGKIGKRCGASEAVLAEVEKGRLAAIDRHHGLRKAQREYCDDIKLEDWVDTAKQARDAEGDA